MRYTPAACAMALALACVSSVATGQKPDTEIAPQSIALLKEGRALAAAGNFQGATDAIEGALVADPRNREAYTALAEVAKRQDLNGKAIRLYREALKIDPNDLNALAGQGEAMVAKGAVAKARENLARIQKLCVARCIEQGQLAAAIEKGPAPTQLTAKAITPQPVVTQEEAN